MSRTARLVVPGTAHHVTQRGIRRLDIFRDDSDRLEYLRLFTEKSRLFSLRVLAYCLMTNHVHFVVVPEKKDSIWKALHRSHFAYAMKFNAKYGLCGHLWQGRAYSCVLDEGHLWAAVRYVERNPVRAGMARFAEDYPWSSAASHCGVRDDRLIDSNWPAAEQIKDWRQWLRDENLTEIDGLIRKATFKDRPCGDADFVQRIGEKLGRDLRKKKPGPRPRFTGSGENEADRCISDETTD